MKLTVYYDGQYWVGVVEDAAEGRLRAVRHIFGAEPHDAEVLQFVWRDMMRLISSVGSTVDAKQAADRGGVNPKRLARQAAAELRQRGVSTLAQDALKLELEHRKKERRIITRQQREEQEARKRELRMQKAKAKHRGRH